MVNQMSAGVGLVSNLRRQYTPSLPHSLPVKLILKQRVALTLPLPFLKKIYKIECKVNTKEEFWFYDPSVHSYKLPLCLILQLWSAQVFGFLDTFLSTEKSFYRRWIFDVLEHRTEIQRCSSCTCCRKKVVCDW